VLSGRAPEAASPADPRELPDEALAGKQLERAIDDAIRGLAPMYREVLLLRDVEGLSAAEVAEVTSASVDAVKSRLHRARLAVQQHGGGARAWYWSLIGR
jgi:RNA polymerase sigma-70 factor, ECF subfamily